MKVTVFHNVSRDANFGLNVEITREGRANRPASHDLVKVFEFDLAELTAEPAPSVTDVVTSGVVDSIFEAFNVGDDPDRCKGLVHELALKYRARKLRSLSVGDVLAFQVVTAQPCGSVSETAYVACASRGWDSVPDAVLRVLPAKDAEQVIRARYSFRANEALCITVPLTDTQEG